jgi:tripartite-type tricarboxylate transporter receptor subunit TctC
MSVTLARLAVALAMFSLSDRDIARAEDPYPSRPIRLVVGFAAGGSTDIPARYIAVKLGAALGQRVLVENKPGAGGIIATRDVLSQPKDGYNLLLSTHLDSVNTAMYRNPQYELDDLAPISLVSKYYYGLALANSVPASDFGGFVRYAKAHPGEISYSTIGAGSAQEIFAHQIERMFRPFAKLAEARASRAENIKAE